MLIMLTSDQVAARWPLLKRAIIESHPPIVVAKEGYFSRVLLDLYTGAKQARVGMVDGKEIMYGITSHIKDVDDNSNILLIYALWGMTNEVPVSFYKSCLTTIYKYAKLQKYDKVVAYTIHDQIVQMAARAGANTQWHLIEWEL